MIAWSPNHIGRFRIKDYGDDGAVVYDTASGDTHAVDALAMELLQMLLDRAPRSANSISADLAGLLEGETEADVVDAVDRGLAQLQRLGLVVGSAH